VREREREREREYRISSRIERSEKTSQHIIRSLDILSPDGLAAFREQRRIFGSGETREKA
jgi:hypothetical protein